MDNPRQKTDGSASVILLPKQWLPVKRQPASELRLGCFSQLLGRGGYQNNQLMKP
ncbi:MAG: hypothetical protein O4965_24250 [Trichodesmium sp. St19_bin1]|nr:hypothetical protein [Trichodesmium sp. St19_bin1]